MYIVKDIKQTNGGKQFMKFKLKNLNLDKVIGWVFFGAALINIVMDYSPGKIIFSNETLAYWIISTMSFKIARLKKLNGGKN